MFIYEIIEYLRFKTSCICLHKIYDTVLFNCWFLTQYVNKKSFLCVRVASLHFRPRVRVRVEKEGSHVLKGNLDAVIFTPSFLSFVPLFVADDDEQLLIFFFCTVELKVAEVVVILCVAEISSNRLY